MVWLWRLRRSSGSSGGGIASRAVARNLPSACGRSPSARERIRIRSGCWLLAQDAAHPSIAASRSRVERIARGHSFALQEPAQVHGDSRQTGSQANCGTKESPALDRQSEMVWCATDNAMTESGKTQFPKRGLEDENRLLRVEVERLRQILATHGLPTASALINCPTTPPVPLQRPEDRQKRGKQRIALFRSLFRDREDIHARRWTSAAGRSGYSPAALMDWGAIHSSNPEDRKKVARQTRTFLPLTSVFRPEIVHDFSNGNRRGSAMQRRPDWSSNEPQRRR